MTKQCMKEESKYRFSSEDELNKWAKRTKTE